VITARLVRSVLARRFWTPQNNLTTLQEPLEEGFALQVHPHDRNRRNVALYYPGDVLTWVRLGCVSQT
jgi:hypothetical protein